MEFKKDNSFVFILLILFLFLGFAYMFGFYRVETFSVKYFTPKPIDKCSNEEESIILDIRDEESRRIYPLPDSVLASNFDFKKARQFKEFLLNKQIIVASNIEENIKDAVEILNNEGLTNVKEFLIKRSDIPYFIDWERQVNENPPALGKKKIHPLLQKL